jgi:uncharacterized protein (DUF1697 family)
MKHHYVIFIRGVNVGGKATISMATLKSLLEEKGFENVRSYINSGNLAFQSTLDKDGVRKSIHDIIQKNFCLEIDLIVKPKSELEDIIKNNPFDPETERDNSKRVVVMLSGTADPERMNTLKEDKSIEEKIYPVKDLVYIYYYNGIGRSKFTINVIERKLKVTATARNWNTILKMRDA